MKSFVYTINPVQFLPNPDTFVASLSNTDAKFLRGDILSKTPVSDFTLPAKSFIKSVQMEPGTGDISVEIIIGDAIPQRLSKSALSLAPASYLEKIDLLLFRKLRADAPPAPAKTIAATPAKTIPSAATPSAQTAVPIVTKNEAKQDATTSITIPASAVKDRLLEMIDESKINPLQLRKEIAKLLNAGKKSSENRQLKGDGFVISVTQKGFSLTLSDGFFTKNLAALLSGMQAKTLLSIENKAGTLIFK